MRIVIVVLVAMFVSMHILALSKSDEAWKQLPQSESDEYAFSSSVMKITSLEFNGLASDYLFLKAMIDIGAHKSPKEISALQWNRFYHILDVSSDLDPYFVDPYYIGNSFLTWEANMIQEANGLLEKGSQSREWDWTLPFFIGFNYYFFLQENEKASEKLMDAYRRNPEPTLASLASRLAFKASRTENAIAFLEEILAKTDDEPLKERYEIRLKSLRNILMLEQAVMAYKKKYARNPDKVEALIQAHLLLAVPQDPYGGNYFIAKDSTIKSTTSSELEPYMLPIQKNFGKNRR